MRANEYAAVHACIKVGMPWFRMRVCMASHARDWVCAATFRRVRVHVFSTPRDRCTTDPRDEIGRAHAELQSLMRTSYAVYCWKKNRSTQSTQGRTDTNDY